MNDAVRRRVECFSRMNGFLNKYAASLSATPLAATLDSELAGIVEALGGTDADKEEAKRQRGGGTTLKATLRDRIKSEIKLAGTTAEGVAVKEGQPDLPAKFNLPDSNDDATLLSTARAVAKLVSDRAADFQQFGLAATFSADLTQLCTDFGNAGKTQVGGKTDVTENVAETEAHVARGMEIRTQLHAIVTNTMRNDPGARAEWEVARHIERPSRGGGSTPPPTSPAK